MSKIELPKCLKCKSNIEVIPIKYGLPYNEDFDYVQKKKLMLGLKMEKIKKLKT